jgi:hypothetical protein
MDRVPVRSSRCLAALVAALLLPWTVVFVT